MLVNPRVTRPATADGVYNVSLRHGFR